LRAQIIEVIDRQTSEASAYRVRVCGVASAATALPHNPPALHPVEPLLEFDQSEHPIRMAIIEEPIVQRAGWVEVPNRPGLGIAIDRRAVEKFRAR